MVQRVRLKTTQRVKLRTQEQPTDVQHSPLRQHPPSVSETKTQAKQCKHCKHWYLYPCTDPNAELDCLNYIHLQSIKKGKRK